jgi:hypothetical protein
LDDSRPSETPTFETSTSKKSGGGWTKRFRDRIKNYTKKPPAQTNTGTTATKTPNPSSQNEEETKKLEELDVQIIEDTEFFNRQNFNESHFSSKVTPEE